jgi:hypothetical protein
VDSVARQESRKQKMTNKTAMRKLPKKSKYFVYISLFLFCAACTTPVDSFRLETGDLLFQVGEGRMSETIAKVTSGESDINYTHVGIVLVKNDTIFVIEAISSGVSKTLLDTFLLRSAYFEEKPIVAVGRLTQEYRELIPQALVRAKGLLGKPYDFVFCPDNDAYYCSELVEVSFLNRQNIPIFEPISMNFRDVDGNLPTFWIEHFEKHNAVIPENRSGSNPGDLSKSNKIEIIYRYFQ